MVIGNPPYIRPHHLSSETKKQLWRTFETYEKKADIYVCFMERGLKITKQGGVLTFIVSDGWLRLDSFEKVRNYILENSSVQKIVDFSQDVFDSATVKTCIVQLFKDNRMDNVVRFATVKNAVDLSSINFSKVQQDTYLRTYKKVFDLSSDSVSEQLKEKMRAGAVQIGEKFSLSFGLKTGDDEKFLTWDSSISPFCKKLIRGADINRWMINFKGEYVIYLPEQMRRHRPTARPGTADRFEQPKILVRDTGGGLMATFDGDHFYVKDVIILEDSEQRENVLKMLTALLNSKPLRWYYETTFPTLHVQRDELASLPIPKTIFKPDLKIVSLVDRILGAKSADAAADTSTQEAEIDALVYRLYGLTAEEIAVVERMD